MSEARSAKVMVVGVGGAGVNAVRRLLDVGQPGVRYLAVDTSAQTLERVPQDIRLAIPMDDRGLGTGGDARLGMAAALANEGRLRTAMAGSEVVLVVAGMAGGTGGGAAAEVVRIANAGGAATVSFAIMPFAFEGQARSALADRAAKRLEVASGTTVRLANDRLVKVAGAAVSVDLALRIGDDAIRQAVQGLAELLAGHAWLQVDLATLQGFLREGGRGCVAMAIGRGPRAPQEAVEAVVSNPLIEPSVWQRSRAAIVGVSGPTDLAVADVEEMVASLREYLAPECELVVAAGLDRALSRAIQLTVIVTQIDQQSMRLPSEDALASARRLEMVVPMVAAGGSW